MIALANGEGQGSARSIQHFDLAAALAACHEDLLSYGGHAMAAGLRITADRIESFTERFVALANNRLTGDNLVPKLHLDAEVTLDALTLPTAQAIEEIGPFGVGNPKPRLATGWVELVGEPRCVGRSQEHLQASFAQGDVRVRAIGFGMASAVEDLKQHRRCRVAFAPIINEFNGRRTVEMQMLDLHFPG
jgi:single-stranded-DNA-specific exonuclease